MCRKLCGDVGGSNIKKIRIDCSRVIDGKTEEWIEEILISDKIEIIKHTSQQEKPPENHDSDAE